MPSISEIDMRIEVFQGSADLFAPPKFSEYLADTSKDGRLNSIEGKGHFHHLAYGFETLGEVKYLFYFEGGSTR